MHKRRWLAHSLLTIGLASFCTLGHARTAGPEGLSEGKRIGKASYYSDKFHGRRTASGERYDRNALTADHPFLPFGTVLRVTNLQNHRSVEVRVNDRHRLRGGRVLDLSRRAASELRFVGAGVAMVQFEIVQLGDS
ncbi:septal ring lytic transglycosylase RlpA family protein [Methylococcus sp. EFPC2]|uniref:septal ring lytic transglycosylase RlpA family protein n=1 Tax=Methylococcus sp. EFPC2 TaxID=2812648 RepID=UPI0019687768|nr:septal ring lytic transglycosylase RlpA family protein [Methylococcus sp. EFPC2]QSA98204.1 septal ring lytic transglycosylase RlpA family protein [Methylococcus sp. EFPC2]